MMLKLSNEELLFGVKMKSLNVLATSVRPDTAEELATYITVGNAVTMGNASQQLTCHLGFAKHSAAVYK